MAVLTIRPKNQVTIPQRVLEQAGLTAGDPIEFAALPDGGVALYPYGWAERQSSLWAMAVAVAASVPGIGEVDWPTPPRDLDVREVAW